MQLRVEHRNAFLRILRQEFRADMAVLSVLDDAGTTFEHYAATKHSTSIEVLALEREPESFCSEVIDRAEPVAIFARSTLPGERGCSVMRAEGLESYLGVPLTLEDRVAGTLDIMTKLPRAWTKDDQDRLVDFAKVLLQTFNTASDETPSHLRIIQG